MWTRARIISIACGLVALMIGVSPNDAQSNLSKWLSLLFDNLPEVLRVPAADKWAMAAFVFLALAFLFGPWIAKKANWIADDVCPSPDIKAAAAYSMILQRSKWVAHWKKIGVISQLECSR
jgi:hypothetical protein